MGVWQGVAMDSLKFYLSPSCPTLLRPEMALQPFQGFSAYRVDDPLDTSRRTPMNVTVEVLSENEETSDHSEPLGTGDGGQETDDERQGTSDDQRGSALGPWARGARYFMVTGGPNFMEVQRV
jgi:hypothetical protein